MAASANVFAVRTTPGTRRTIPFDYSFTFALSGTPQAVQSKTITVSVEGPFVATSIGYGFAPRVEAVRFGGVRADFVSPLPVPAAFAMAAVPPVNFPPVTVDSISLGKLLDMASRAFGEANMRRGQIGPRTAAILESGFRLNPDAARQILAGRSSEPIDDSLLANLFEAVVPASCDVQFLYALFDEGTGRAFQSDPILNTAGLGSSSGERPFRQFTAPITFAPRTTVRMEVTELQTRRGALYVSLHGYKELGGEGSPTASGLLPPPANDIVRRRRLSR